jgi:hypothetical protein
MLSEGQRFVIVDDRMNAGLYSKGETGTITVANRSGYKAVLDSGKEAFLLPNEILALGDHIQPAQADDADVDYASELRDQFAASALTGLLICKPMGPSEIARRAWELADAMLQARGQ